MKLYTHPRAPNPRRVNLLVAYKGIELPTQIVDMASREQLSPAYLEKVPRGIVPALELDDGTTLCESLAIASYLEEKFPLQPLLGRTPEERAHIISWDQYQYDGGFLSVFEVVRNTMPAFASHAISGQLEMPQIPALAERGKQRQPAFLRAVDKALTGRNYLVGDRLSWADISLFTSVDFAIMVKLPIPAECENLQGWFNRVKAELAPFEPKT